MTVPPQRRPDEGRAAVPAARVPVQPDLRSCSDAAYRAHLRRFHGVPAFGTVGESAHARHARLHTDGIVKRPHDHLQAAVSPRQ